MESTPQHPSNPIPDGISPDARETWPSSELISSWLGDVDLDVEWRPGETSSIDAEDAEALAAARRFRDVLGRFASGVTVVTTLSNGEPVGMTCQSFSSVSLDPPLVLFVPARTSRAWPLIQRAGRFCVNILAEDQAELSNQMASRGTDKFAGVEWTPSAETGSPVLPGTLAHVDCAIHAVHEAGDHYVVVGRVLGLGLAPTDPAQADPAQADPAQADPTQETEPLLFFEGAYRRTAPPTPRP